MGIRAGVVSGIGVLGGAGGIGEESGMEVSGGGVGSEWGKAQPSITAVVPAPIISKKFRLESFLSGLDMLHPTIAKSFSPPTIKKLPLAVICFGSNPICKSDLP